jgi:hypothetical protein
VRNVLQRIGPFVFGAVAATLSILVVVTFSRATVSTRDLGTLKCYNIRGVQKAC